MDYEKAYNELIGKLRDARNGENQDDRFRVVIDMVIPELEESEDERIRKAFIKVYQGFCPTDKWNKEITFRQIVAWLERLGDKAFSVERLFAEAGIKPAYKDGNSWCVLIGENIQEGICGFGETPKDAYVNFLKELWGKAFEQNPAWSEEDEKRFTRVCVFIKNTTLQNVDEVKADLISWFKALKERYTWKPTMQQLTILSKAIELRPLYERDGTILMSLYNDLKKL